MIGTTDKAWSNGEWSTTVQGQNFGPVEIKGYWSDVNVREGNNRSRQRFEESGTVACGMPAGTRAKGINRAWSAAM